MVKFISYDGCYPVLCWGTLTLEIDGERVSFGFNASNPQFWTSTGYVYFTDDYSNAEIVTGSWAIDSMKCIPEKYRKYADEMIAVMNDNVTAPCCGGCI